MKIWSFFTKFLKIILFLLERWNFPDIEVFLKLTDMSKTCRDTRLFKTLINWKIDFWAIFTAIYILLWKICLHRLLTFRSITKMLLKMWIIFCEKFTIGIWKKVRIPLRRTVAWWPTRPIFFCDIHVVGWLVGFGWVLW